LPQLNIDIIFSALGKNTWCSV